MMQDKDGKSQKTLLTGRVVLKDMGLAQDRKWLVDAGVETIEWEFVDDDGWPLLFVRVMVDESRPEDESGCKPWESITWKINIPPNYLGKNFKGVFAELPLRENADQAEQIVDGDIYRAGYSSQKNSFELALKLNRPPGKAPAWLDDKGFRLLFMESKKNYARVTIPIESDSLHGSISSFGKPESRNTQNENAAPPDLALDITQNITQDITQDITPDIAPDITQDIAQDIALEKETREHENRAKNLLAQLDTIKSEINKLSGRIENLDLKKLQEASTSVARLEKRLKDIAEEAKGQDSAEQPSQKPFSAGALQQEEKQELVDALVLQIPGSKFFEQGVRDALARELAGPENIARILEDKALGKLLANAIKEAASPLISNLLLYSDKPDGLVSNILKELLENHVSRLLPPNKSSQEKLFEIAEGILKDKIAQILPAKSLEQNISRIIQEAAWPELEKRINESLAALDHKLNDCIQKTDACQKSLAELEPDSSRRAVLSMPDWDGIANWLIKACLGIGQENAAIDLKNWYKELLKRVAELLPTAIGKLDLSIEREIKLLLGPLTAKYDRILGLFGEAARSAPDDNCQDAERALADSFYQGFVENVVSAFKMSGTENGPTEALSSPFEYGWQMIWTRLAQAWRFSSQGKSLPGFEEIKQQFAAKEIFDLVHTNRTRVMDLHEKVPPGHRKSLEELDNAFMQIEEFAGLERIAPEPGQDYLDERLHSISKQVSEKEFFPNQVTEVDRIGYRLKSTGEVLARARVVVNRRSS